MCGIAGILKFDGSAVVPLEFFNMLLSIRHRGPDDEGAVLLESSSGKYELRGGPDTPSELNLADLRSPVGIKADLALGNRRLSIIDLSPKGHQPQTNEDGTVWVVCNGEVYNYRELKADLERLGHKFHGDSDTEVIIHGYEEWGIDSLLSKMVGMWGIALWDQRSKKMYLIRDRFGIKPLYYFVDEEKLIFASEIKAIRIVQRAEVNENRISEFLWFQPYHPSETFYEGITQLMASHYIEFDLPSKSQKTSRYWNLKEVNDTYENVDIKECSRVFYEHFEKSIRLHMRSDVPVGTCLSGGLDSSSIVCLSQKMLRNGAFEEKGLKNIDRLKSFSSVPTYEGLSELPYIKEVVLFCGVDPYYVSPNFEGFMEDFESLIGFHDQPFEGPSVYMQYCVMRLANEKGIKVLLDGQGGDESLAGYHSYLQNYYTDLLKGGHYIKAIKELIASRDLASPLVGTYLRNKLKLNRVSIEGIVKLPRPAKEALPTSNLASILRYDLLEGKIIELLKYEDINSMIFSIESRVPFLYHPMIEYLFKIPMSAKIQKGWTKYILREAMRGTIPENIRTRRTKLGFPAPERDWALLLIGQYSDWCLEKISYAEKYVDIECFKKLCKRIVSKKRREDIKLFWRILILSKWLESNTKYSAKN